MQIIRGDFKSDSKNGKAGIAKNCKGWFDPASPEGYAVTRAAVCLFRRSKRRLFDNFEEF